jgi:ribonuclease P protein component
VPFVTPSNPIEGAQRDWPFPKGARLLRRSDFREVYDKGFRVSGPYFAGICLRVEGQAKARIGFAVPKAAGGSVIRNRLKRRLREAVRLSLPQLEPQWNVVFQARLGALEAPFADLKREVEKLFSRCERS